LAAAKTTAGVLSTQQITGQQPQGNGEKITGRPSTLYIREDQPVIISQALLWKHQMVCTVCIIQK
jgi:hypothetical protein